MLHCFTSLDQTRQEARLYFAESADSLLYRMRQFSGTRLPVGRGLIPRSHVTTEGDELQVSQFGRRLLRGRLDPHSQGCLLTLVSSAPVFRVAVYFWIFVAACSFYASFSDIVFIAETGRSPFDTVGGKFLLCSLLGTLVFPVLWGRRWEFRRIAAALSERLQATNNSELQSASRDTSLARWGAWVCFLATFVAAPLLVMSGFEMPFAGLPSWMKRQPIHTVVMAVDLTVLFLMPFVGWMFAGAGAVSGLLVARFLTNGSPRFRYWATTPLAVCVSLLLCRSFFSSKAWFQILDFSGGPV